MPELVQIPGGIVPRYRWKHQASVIRINDPITCPGCERTISPQPMCGGSNSAGSVRRMVAACTDAGVRRLLVVGGTPNQWDELEALLAANAIELRT